MTPDFESEFTFAITAPSLDSLSALFAATF